MSPAVLVLVLAPPMRPPASTWVCTASGDTRSGANRDGSAVPVLAKSPEVDRGKGTRGPRSAGPGAEGDVSIWSLSALCLYELDTRASSKPFSLGTYDGRGEGRELLFRGARAGLIAPVGGDGVLDSRLEDGLGCLSLLREECLGIGSSADD